MVDFRRELAFHQGKLDLERMAPRLRPLGGSEHGARRALET
jgi:hypothetical protein